MPSVVRRRRPRLWTSLTAKDRRRFAFLLRHLPKPKRTEGGEPDADDVPDLETVLERCKAATVPLDRLSEYLLIELAWASNPNALVTEKERKDRLDQGIKHFRQARRLLSGMPVPLGRRTGRAHPEALLEILDAVAGALVKMQELAHQMVAGLRQREVQRGAKTTGRKLQENLDYASLGISVRDDVRELRRAVRYVALHAPLRYGAGVTLTRMPDDRCAACNNPASRLFRRGK